MEEFRKWAKIYREKFGDSFPSMKYTTLSYEEMVEKIKAAVESGVEETDVEEGVVY